MGFLGEILSGAIKPEEISKALQPVLRDAEAAIAAAVSTAIEGGIDRLDGVQITITVKFPVARATPIVRDADAAGNNQ